MAMGMAVYVRSSSGGAVHRRHSAYILAQWKVTKTFKYDPFGHWIDLQVFENAIVSRGLITLEPGGWEHLNSL